MVLFRGLHRPGGGSSDKAQAVKLSCSGAVIGIVLGLIVYKALMASIQ